jgi:hypothetical protein
MEFYDPKKDNHLTAETRFSMIFERNLYPECRVELEKTSRGLFCKKCKKLKATMDLFAEAKG